MKVLQMDMFNFLGKVDAMCITTNGYVKKNGEAVMGAETAKQMAERFPMLPRQYGKILKKYDLCTLPICSHDRTTIVAFPVKPEGDTSTEDNVVTHMQERYAEGSYVPGWALKADPDLIRQSAKQLTALTESYGWREVLLPCPGCGAGELSWEKDIYPVLEDVLKSHRYICCYL